MGMFNKIIVECPNCKRKHEFQSKGGDCLLETYTLKNCPDNVLGDSNRHSPEKCKCGALLEIDIYNRTVKLVTNELSLD